MFEPTHLHAMIIHFPIALVMVGFLAEIVGIISKKEFFGKAAFYLLILGTIGVISAYISGQYAGDGIVETGALKNALETHEDAAALSLWLMVGASLVRIAFVLFKKYQVILKWISFVLFLLGVLSVARTGYYGGNLVYKHAAGVQINLGFDAQSENLPSEQTKVDKD